MSEWLEESLGQIASVEIGGTPSREVLRYWASEDTEGYPWVSIADLGPRYVVETKERITSLGVQHSNVKKILKGTMVMSFKLTIGRSGIADVDLYTNEAIAAIIPKNQRLDSRYLYYSLPPIAKNAITDVAIKGSTLNKEKLNKLKIKFPKQIGVQRRIAEILSTIDDAIEQTEALIKKTQQIKAGLMHDLFTRGVLPNGQLRPPREEAPELYKDSKTPLGWVPKEWEVVSLEKIAESLIDGPFGSNLKTEHYVKDGGVRVVRLQNILNSKYNDSDPVFISEKHAKYLERHKVVTHDILIAALGEDHYPVGRACCYPPDLPPAINKADCFRLRCAPLIAISKYIMYFVNTAVVRTQIRRFEQGVTRRRINLGNMKRIRVGLSPLEEQSSIVEKMNEVEMHLNMLEGNNLVFQNEKNGLMHDLLSGRVPVTKE